MVSDTTASTRDATSVSISASWAARPIPMKANSPPGASNRPTSALADHERPQARQSGVSTAALRAIIVVTPASTIRG